MRLGSGKLTLPQDQPGLDLLANQLFVKGGLEAHNADSLKRILAGKSVEVDFDVGDDAFIFTGKTSPDDFLLQLQLLSAYIMAPGFRIEAERLAYHDLEKHYIKLKRTVEGVVADEIETFLAGGDERFGFPEKEVLLGYSTEDVSEWLLPHLENAYIEVSVVGDIELAEAEAAVAKTLGAFSSRNKEKKNFDARRILNFPDPNQNKTAYADTDIQRAASLVYWETDDIWDIHKTRRLSLLSQVFSDRLRVQLREALGDVYSPYAANVPSEVYWDYVYFFAKSTTDPDKVSAINTIVIGIGEELVQNGVTQDELDRTLKPMLNRIKLYTRTNAYWLHRVLAKSQERPVCLDWAKSMLSDYASITVEDLNKLAREYLSADRGVRVEVLPGAPLNPDKAAANY